MDDLISRRAAINALDKRFDGVPMELTTEILQLRRDLSKLPSTQSVLTCDGCRHVGTYDTDFPCSGCIRREKDYYEQER